MVTDQKRLNLLFDKYLQRKCSAEELDELLALLQDANAEETLNPQMAAIWEWMKTEGKVYPVDWQRIYDQVIRTDVARNNKRPLRKIYRIAAAIAVLLVLSAGGYFYLFSLRTNSENTITLHGQQDIVPGGNKAVLTLANGKAIVLDQAKKGMLIQQGNAKVIKLDSGQLAYKEQKTGEREEAVGYNTLRTPRGGQYRLILPDGTKVWLNAASSIRFPTAFAAKERKVQITGEVYFEVAPDMDKPFGVKTGNTEIKVLGTHFNVNAYADEPMIKTTLLEGKVKVVSVAGDGKSMVITPGEQALVEKGGQMKLVKGVNLDEVVDWKNGFFVFHMNDLPAIMRRLSRWYNVEVEYKNNKVPSSHFTGTVPRQENISKVLKMLELTGGVHFKIEERKIIIGE